MLSCWSLLLLSISFYIFSALKKKQTPLKNMDKNRRLKTLSNIRSHLKFDFYFWFIENFAHIFLSHYTNITWFPCVMFSMAANIDSAGERRKSFASSLTYKFIYGLYFFCFSYLSRFCYSLNVFRSGPFPYFVVLINVLGLPM